MNELEDRWRNLMDGLQERVREGGRGTGSYRREGGVREEGRGGKLEE